MIHTMEQCALELDLLSRQGLYMYLRWGMQANEEWFRATISVLIGKLTHLDVKEQQRDIVSCQSKP